MSDIETCKNCKFAEQFKKWLYCHRYPPILCSEDGVIFICVNDDDWCGEFKVKESPFPISDQSVELPPYAPKTRDTF